jgi:Fur family transcriptional regulator, ferric uptake regulator
MHIIDIFKDFIKEKRFRWTPQREIIMEVFSNSEQHLTAEEIFKVTTQKNSSIGIATVYRTMALLCEAGLAREGTNLCGKITFEPLYQRKQHDHLICTQCGIILEFEHPLIDKYRKDICLQHDFILQSHRLDLYGTCKDCTPSIIPNLPSS